MAQTKTKNPNKTGCCAEADEHGLPIWVDPRTTEHTGPQMKGWALLSNTRVASDGVESWTTGTWVNVTYCPFCGMVLPTEGR